MSSREAFEKWAEGEGFSLRRAANYCEWEARSLWEAWQLATERAATATASCGCRRKTTQPGNRGL